jgi:hypothetical protein
MVNLMLTVDDAVLERARQRALEEGTSVNAQVRAFLHRYAGSGSGFEEFLALTSGLGARSGPEGRTWRRVDLHERRRVVVSEPFSCATSGVGQDLVLRWSPHPAGRGATNVKVRR